MYCNTNVHFCCTITLTQFIAHIQSNSLAHVRSTNYDYKLRYSLFLLRWKQPKFYTILHQRHHCRHSALKMTTMTMCRCFSVLCQQRKSTTKRGLLASSPSYTINTSYQNPTASRRIHMFTALSKRRHALRLVVVRARARRCRDETSRHGTDSILQKQRRQRRQYIKYARVNSKRVAGPRKPA